MHQNGYTTCLHVSELYYSVPSRQLEQHPRRQQHEQHHRYNHRTPICHSLSLQYLSSSYKR
uniref:Uncharacterized protein n=1 Tax=Nelumbo nucifera TaxID=4432 RepID=A0A822YY87_NELNU|nr:TPA_asm: hypothetical protein HUJ06_004858 [Nelumbo nucifera]